MSALPKTAPSSSAVLTKAVLKAAELLDVPPRELGQILGVSPSSVSRLSGDRRIEPETKEGELGLLFLRVFRSLDALLGGDTEKSRRWLRAHNHHLAGTPVELLHSVTGLASVAEYLDAMRGRA